MKKKIIKEHHEKMDIELSEFSRVCHRKIDEFLKYEELKETRLLEPSFILSRLIVQLVGEQWNSPMAPSIVLNLSLLRNLLK